MKIHITRHGQTDWNAKNWVLGSTDKPLNETGKAQARQAAENFKDLPLTAIYYSPMDRAKETAETIAMYHDCPLIPADALKEQDYGVFEGWSRADPLYQQEKYQFFKPFENGESFLDVAARVYPFLDELKGKYGEDDEILLVTHGGICRMIHNYFDGMDNDTFAKYFMENCQVETFTI